MRSLTERLRIAEAESSETSGARSAELQAALEELEACKQAASRAQREAWATSQAELAEAHTRLAASEEGGREAMESREEMRQQLEELARALSAAREEVASSKVRNVRGFRSPCS